MNMPANAKRGKNAIAVMIVSVKRMRVIKKVIKYFERILKSPYQDDQLRMMAVFVKEYMKGELTGGEIGGHLGINAEQMLEKMNLKKLYIIDPYENYGDYIEEGKWTEEHYGKFSEIESKMKKRLNKYRDRYVHIKKKSADAIKDVPDNLDFVYIDGNHKYEYVLEDIELYYKKIKEGGVIGGHDFNTPYTPEVTNAVIDFVKKNNLQLFSYGKDWWIIKGEKRQGNKEILKKYGWRLMHIFECKDKKVEEWWCKKN